jgi:hypothetical protein
MQGRSEFLRALNKCKKKHKTHTPEMNCEEARRKKRDDDVRGYTDIKASDVELRRVNSMGRALLA